MDSPASSVMTDFTVIQPITVAPNVPIDSALETMRVAGVRLLLVTNAAEEIIGVVSSQDIQGEKPVELFRQRRLWRSEITVAMVMTSQAETEVLALDAVSRVRVGHIVETLRQMERQHVLVVEVDDATGTQRVCGMFSLTQIARQVGVEVHRLDEEADPGEIVQLVRGGN
jgi:CBS domain containing-hemolysin-like protein